MHFLRITHASLEVSLAPVACLLVPWWKEVAPSSRRGSRAARFRGACEWRRDYVTNLTSA